MHEMSLALEIREICGRELAKEPGARLRGLGVEVGAFAGVEVQSLRFCLEAVMSERYGAVDCDVSTVPGRAVCVSCGDEFTVTRAPFECPGCGGWAHGVSGAGDLQVSYLEVE